jgi:hypothetical protein
VFGPHALGIGTVPRALLLDRGAGLIDGCVKLGSERGGPLFKACAQSCLALAGSLTSAPGKRLPPLALTCMPPLKLRHSSSVSSLYSRNLFLGRLRRAGVKLQRALLSGGLTRALCSILASAGSTPLH